jgi:GNAT superfamily N-acetyltransferase
MRFGGEDNIDLTGKARNFDVTGFEAHKMWQEIASSGEDTIAVARASYEAGGKARHRLHAVGWLAFDARFSAEAREFAVEVLADRSSKVVEAAARALAWGWDVTLLPLMRKAAAQQRRAARADIEAAIAAIEAGNPSLFLDRTGGGRLHMRVSDHNWRELRGGLIRCAQPRHAATLLGIVREASEKAIPIAVRDQSLEEQQLRSDIDENVCWIVGSPIAGWLVARGEQEDWWIKGIAVTEDGWNAGYFTTLLEFAEHEARRRGFGRIFLPTRDKAAAARICGELGYRRSADQGRSGIAEVLLEKAL